MQDSYSAIVDKLVEALTECDCLQNLSDRNIIVKELNSIHKRIPESSLLQEHIRNIIKTCLKYEGGLDSFVDRVRVREGDSFPMREVDKCYKCYKDFLTQIDESSSLKPTNHSFEYESKKVALEILYDEAILLLTSKDPSNDTSGTGFIFLNDNSNIYILTLTDLVNKLGGIEQINIENYIQIYKVNNFLDSHKTEQADVSILYIENFEDSDVSIPISNPKKLGIPVKIIGWLTNQSDYLRKSVPGQVVGFPGRIKNSKNKKREGQKSFFLVNFNQTEFESTLLGAPVISIDSRGAIGILAGFNIDEHMGSAIPIAKMLKTVNRKIVKYYNYDLNHLSRLLTSKLDSIENFNNFCLKNFPNYQSKSYSTSSLYINVELLIIYCHVNNLIEHLVDSINKYRTRYFDLFFYKIINFYYLIANKFSSGREQPLKVIFKEDYTNSSNKIIAAILFALEKLLKTKPNNIFLSKIEKGSTVFYLQMPAHAANRLLDYYQNKDYVIEDLGILDIEEILVEKYNLQNIKKVLNVLYDRSGLISLCKKHYPEILPNITKFSTKWIIASQIVSFVKKSNKVDELLDLIKFEKPYVYRQYQPYERKPIIASRFRSKKKVNIDKDFIIPLGFGFAMAFIVALACAIYTGGPRSANAGWYGLLLIPLGALVGIVISEVSRIMKTHRSKIEKLLYFTPVVFLIGTQSGEFLHYIFFDSNQTFTLFTLIIQYFANLYVVLTYPEGAAGCLGGGYLAYEFVRRNK